MSLIKVTRAHYRELLHERAGILEFDGGWSSGISSIMALKELQETHEICPILTAADERDRQV